MKKNADTYKEIKVFEYPNIIIRVNIPDLTDAERNKRMKDVKRAAAAMLGGTIKDVAGF